MHRAIEVKFGETRNSLLAKKYFFLAVPDREAQEILDSSERRHSHIGMTKALSFKGLTQTCRLEDGSPTSI